VKRVLPLATILLATQAAAVEFNAVQADKSRLGFGYKQMGVAMDGSFRKFSAQLAFDPAKPAAARVAIDVDLASIDTGSSEGDSEVAGKQWFDTKAHPTARFVSSTVKPLGGNRYEVGGTLTIKGRSREVATTALAGMGLLTFLVLLALQGHSRFVAGLVLGDDNLDLYFRIVFFSIALQTLATVPESVLLAQKRSRVYSTITLLTFVSYLSLNILFIVGLEMGVLGMLVSMLATKVLNTAMNFWVTRADFAPRISLEKFRRMAAFGLPLIPASMAMLAIHYADRIFVQRYCPAADLGLYSLGYKFGMMLSFLVSQPIFFAWNTLRYEMAADDDPARGFGRIFTYILVIIVYAALGLSVLSPEAIRIMTPDEYQGAASIVTIIVASYVFNGIQNFLTSGIYVSYKTTYMPVINMVAAACNILLNLLLVPSYGIHGAAWATLFLVIPMMLHSVGTVLLMYLVTNLILGVVISVVFQMAHTVEEADFVPPPPGAPIEPGRIAPARLPIAFSAQPAKPAATSPTEDLPPAAGCPEPSEGRAIPAPVPTMMGRFHTGR